VASHDFLIVPVSLLFFLPFLIEKRTALGFVANVVIGLALLVPGVRLLRRAIS
jgi:hypothetical protein